MALSHDPTLEVRDPIYDFVTLSQAEWAVINTPSFGRLRDIRQLAMGHLVYPGAVHTRFEHSIGVVHLATLMFDSLIDRDAAVLESEFGLTNSALHRARQVLRLAAMLHDVGHPPFSHSGEHLLPLVVPTSDSLSAKQARLSHEEMTANLIRETEIADVIRTEFGPQAITLDEVIAVATEFRYAPGFALQPYHSFLHQLLTGELGADRIDYLLRDAYHSGQRAGTFDFERLIRCIRLVSAPKETEPLPKIGLDTGGWLVAEQMIVARYLMYQSLYFHKTKRVFEKHLESFMREWLPTRFGKAELPGNVHDYVALSDSHIWAAIGTASLSASSAGHGHAVRFRGRLQMRLARELILAENCTQFSNGRRIPNKKRFANLAEQVRIKFGAAVITDEPDHSATKVFDETHKILVVLDETPRYLDDISEIVRGMSSKIWRGRIYADSVRRSEVRDFANDWLRDNPSVESV